MEANPCPNLEDLPAMRPWFRNGSVDELEFFFGGFTMIGGWDCCKAFEAAMEALQLSRRVGYRRGEVGEIRLFKIFQSPT